MKYTNCDHYSPLLKIIFICLLFLLTSLTQAENEKKKQEILRNTCNEIIKENKHSQQAKQIISMLDSVASLKILPDKDFATTILFVTGFLRRQGDLPTIIKLLSTSVSFYEQSDQQTKQIQEALVAFYIPLGASHEELGLWTRAMEFNHKALKIAEELNLDNHKALIYNNIGNIHFNRTRSEKAELYFRKALQINLKNKNQRELFNNYNNLAGVYFNKRNYNLALNYTLKAIQALDNQAEPYLYYFMQANIARIHMQRKDYKSAVGYLKNAMENQEKLNSTSDLIETYYMFARIYNNMNRHDSVQYYINKTIKQIDIIQNKHIESKILGNISLLYTKTHNYNNAYWALKKSSKLKDSIQRVDNKKKIDDLEKVYDADRKIKNNEILLKEISLKETASTRLWIIMFIVALLLIITIIFLTNRARNNEKIRTTNETLLHQKQALHEKEKELQKQKEKELSYAIDLKNRELTSYTLHMIRKNEFMSNLEEELKQLLLQIKSQEKVHRGHVQQILNKLYQQNNSTINWDEFKYYFEQVHPFFNENLGKHYPDLTMKEKRLCAFLRLGLSTKEISAITFKEIRSVETARNRLRKKIDLPSEGNLTEFLCHNINLNSAQ